MKPSGDLILPSERRRKVSYLLRSHLGGQSQHSLAQLSSLTGRQPIVMSVSRLWRTCTITNRNGRHDQQ